MGSISAYGMINPSIFHYRLSFYSSPQSPKFSLFCHKQVQTKIKRSLTILSDYQDSQDREIKRKQTLLVHVDSIFSSDFWSFCVKWVPCHHGKARPQVADGGEGLQIWRVAANILNNKSQTDDKGWPSSLGLGGG
jgi:hypothetical protein